MIFVDRYTSYHLASKTKSYIIEIVKVPIKDRLFYNLYHWYDMRFPIRVPGWKRFEEWLGKHGGRRLLIEKHFLGNEYRENLRDRLYDWTVKQDLRCFDLSKKNSTFIARFEVEKDVFDACA